ncbi:hypothetical protein TNCV_3323841 [Trichonephila clavipes]|nr:hypothetical protein TNCV_3323841 [Trichonephila clavipes]
MRTTPELTPPLITTTPMGERLSSPQILRTLLPYTAGLSWYWTRTHDMPAMIRYLDHWTTAVLKSYRSAVVY